MTIKFKDNGMIWQTELPLSLVRRGKVRDIYEIGKDRLLIITTDRLSAFDVVLPNPIPFKGQVLNQISRFWFDYFKDIVANHLDVCYKEVLSKEILEKHGAQLKGRTVLVKRAEPLSIECVVRGYVAGSGWKDYQKTGMICGHVLPKGLKQCTKLQEPIFTPATKATVGHDENIDFNRAVSIVGREIAEKVRDLSIQIYLKGREYAEKRGILIADTKFEFGILDGKLILIDEVLTPDSSRFWPKDGYEEGHDQPSLDKQIVRDFLEKSGWGKTPPGPALPQDIVEKTSLAYQDVYTRLTENY